MSTESTDPIRAMIGARLRQLRLTSNLTTEAAATAVGSSKPTISRMERGLAPLHRDTLIGLLTLYGVTDPYQQSVLVSLATGHYEPGWWFADNVPLEETVLWANEQHADLIRTYQPSLIPDLLQTEEYARAAHLAAHYPSPPAAATETAMANLMRRQKARKAKLWAVIGENVLRWPVSGDLGLHTRQLDALADAVRTQDVVIQIVPMDAPFRVTCEAFTIYSMPDTQVLALHQYGGDEVIPLRERDRYGLLFDQFIGVAARRSETPRILAQIRDELQARRP